MSEKKNGLPSLRKTPLDFLSPDEARQAVKPVRMSERTLLVEGLTPGQWVVTAGVNYLKEGQEVRLLEDEAPAAPVPAPGATAPANTSARAEGSAAR